MKRYRLLMMFGCLSAPLAAQTEPPSVPEPPVVTAGRAYSFAMAQGEPRATAMLGVSTSPLSSVLSAQLGLKEGLVVEHVVTGSPAAQAGLMPQDILLKVNDQLLFNAAQLASLVNYYGASKEVVLVYMRKGTRGEAKCVLKEVPANTGSPWAETKEASVQIALDAVSGNAVVMGKRIDLDQAFTKVKVPDGAALTFENKNSSRILVIRDAKGESVFEGPVDTEEQKKKVPEEYRKFLHFAENPFKVQLPK